MEPTIARVEQDLIDLDRGLNTAKLFRRMLKRLHSYRGAPLGGRGPERVGL